MTSEEKFKKLTCGNVKTLIMSLAFPTIMTMLITTFYNMADAFFVGTINPSASGAVSVVFSFMAIIQAFGFFFGHGSGNYISRKLGDRDYIEAEKMATIGFFSALFFGMLILVFGFIFLSPLCVLLGSTPTIKPYAMDYLKFILLGAPYMTASLVLNNQLRFQGSAMYAMIGMCTGGVINIGLDALFILVLGMGTDGAGLATAISQLISFILLLIGTRRGGNIRIKVKNLKFINVKYIGEIVRGGLPSLGRQSISSLATVSLNFVCAAVGGATIDELIAAMGIVTKIIGFFASAIIGFGQGFQPVCGFNYGAGKYSRVLEGYKFSVTVSTLFSLIIGLLGITLRSVVLPLFTNSQTVVDLAENAFIAQCISFGIIGFLTVTNMMLQNIGRVVSATILALARQGLCFIPILFCLSFSFGVFGVQISQAIADISAFLICVPIAVSVLKNLKALSLAEQ